MNDTVSSTLKYGRWEADANTLPPKAIAYLLANGFNQSMTDAAACTREERAKHLREGGFESDAKAVEGSAKATISTEGATYFASVVDKWRQERFDAIVAGTVGARVGGGGGPRKDPLLRAMEDIAEERLRALCTQRNVAMPKADVRKSAIAKLIERGGEALKSEAQARLASAAQMADELGDLLSGGEASGDETQQAAE